MPSDLARRKRKTRRPPRFGAGGPLPIKARTPITGGENPPWPERLEQTIVWSHGLGSFIKEPCFDGPCPADPRRPKEWHEIVRDGRVVMRSRRPLSTLKTVCRVDLGERIYLARRRYPSSGVTGVLRYLAFGLIEGS